MINKLNIVLLIISVASLLTGLVFYFLSNENLITIFQLIFSSISSIALFSSLLIIGKSIHKSKIILTAIGYLTFLSFLVTFIDSDLILKIWNIQISAILLLLFSALDSKLGLTKLYRVKLFIWTYRIGCTFLIFSTLLKLNYSIIFSVGIISLLLLTTISIGGIVSSQKN